VREDKPASRVAGRVCAHLVPAGLSTRRAGGHARCHFP